VVGAAAGPETEIAHRMKPVTALRAVAIDSPQRTRRTQLTRETIAVVLAAGFVLSGCGQPPPPYKPVADVKQLMQGVFDPSADVVWGSVGTIFTKEGVEERRPRNDEEWANVRNHAMILTEAGNLLMMPSRARDGGDWMTMSQELIDASAVALRAAEAKNVDRLFEVGGRIYDACDKCHKKYWVKD
jgi:hypothetical protein